MGGNELRVRGEEWSYVRNRRMEEGMGARKEKERGRGEREL